MLNNLVINNIEVNWARAELHVQGKTQSLEPKLLAVLACLVKANGDIVSQQNLLEQVWGETVVSANTVQRCITQLRKLLNDDAKRQTVIQTHPKLGYSLVVSSIVSMSTIDDSTFQRPNGLQRLAIIFIGLLTLGILLATQKSTTKNIQIEKPPKLSNLSPITVHGELVSSYIKSDNDELFYATEQNGKHKIVKHNISGEHEILRENFNLYGELSIDPSQRKLTYGHQYLIDDTKCVDLVTQDIKSRKIQTLVPCQSIFNHSATWLDEQNLVYLQYNKNRQSSLHHLNITSETSKPIPLEVSPLFAEFNQALQQLLITTKNSVLVLKFDGQGNGFTAVKKHVLSFKNVTNSKARWYEDDAWFISHKQNIHWYRERGEIGVTASLSDADILDVQVNNKSLMLLLGRSDWNSRIRNLRVQSDLSVDPTSYKEMNGQFQPNGDSIAFISDRLGNPQLWLHDTRNSKPLTPTGDKVDEFVWTTDGTGLFYLTDHHLWLLDLTSEQQRVDTPFNVNRLFQAASDHLLLAVTINHQEKLIWYNLQTGNITTLLDHKVDWAQRIDDNTIITNDPRGRLITYIDGQQQSPTGLPDVIIQWRYFLREGETGKHLYFQDKKQNIWQYNFETDRANIVGQYDQEALFMTDYDATNHRMLSNNFVAQTRNLYSSGVR